MWTASPELMAIGYLVGLLRGRLDATRGDERGMTTETVIITAVLALLAITAGAVITAKVMGKANSIRTE